MFSLVLLIYIGLLLVYGKMSSHSLSRQRWKVWIPYNAFIGVDNLIVGKGTRFIRCVIRGKNRVVIVLGIMKGCKGFSFMDPGQGAQNN